MNTWKRIYRLKLIALTTMGLVLLSGCGGEGGEAAPPPPKEPATCENNLVVFFLCTLTQSTADPANDSALTAIATDVTMSEPQPVGVDGDAAEITAVQAYAGNYSLDNASAVYLPASGAKTASGVRIDGELADEGAAYFIFTPVRTGLHSAYVCAETCAEAVESDQFSLMLLDQGQTTIEATAAAGASNLEVAGELVAGMAYYVAINGYVGAEYRLVIVD